jgi:hypothetical protein
VAWIGSSIGAKGQRKFYSEVSISDMKIKVNDVVSIEGNDPNSPLQLARVMCIFTSYYNYG